MTITESETMKPREPFVDEATLDRLMAQIDAGGLELLGPTGVLTELTSRIMNRAMESERTHHLGYEAGDPAGNGAGNTRNGYSPKTVLTSAGAVPLKIPRDRDGSFEPQLVPKHQRRLEGFNDLVLSLVSRGMTTRDVQAHVRDAYQTDISPELVSKITDAILPDLREWQTRPLDVMYPLLYLDAIVVKVRTDGRVTNRPVYVAMGVDLGGCKHVLGLWLGKGDEGSKYWLSVLTEIRNRGVLDICIACCDGLTGFSDAIEAVWPQTIVQTCVVHLIRNSVRFCAWNERKPVIAALRPIYQAATAEAAGVELDKFETAWGGRYPAIVELWRRNWQRFIPFLDFDPAIRRIIYTTNAIESLNYQLRKVTKTRGSFPTDDAVLKIFYLAICNIGHERGGDLGTHTQGWKRALNAFVIAFPGRIPDTLN